MSAIAVGKRREAAQARSRMLRFTRTSICCGLAGSRNLDAKQLRELVLASGVSAALHTLTTDD